MWEQVQIFWQKVPTWIKNKYFIAIACFAIVLIFLDTNNVFQLYKRNSKLKQLQRQEMKYNLELVELEEQKEAFDTNLEALEKFAREEYRMKKKNEDVYVIVKKEASEEE